VYLDTAASSLKPNAVIDALTAYYRDLSVNIHRGLYQESLDATRLYEASRARVAAFIHADVTETIFTRGATSALNLVMHSYGRKMIQPGDEIVTSYLEHHSSLLPWQQLAREKGLALKYIPLTKSGRITPGNVAKVLTDKTRIVAITYVSNVMGYVTPIKEIIDLAHQVGAVVIVDAAQAIQHIAIDVKSLDVDFLAFSGHKMLGPTGIGILYGKKALLEKMEPLETGGDMNDRVGLYDAEWKDLPYRFEAGTMPIAEAIGLGRAVEYLNAIGLDQIDRHIGRLTRYALAELAKMPDVVVYNPKTDGSIIAFNLKDIPPHDAVTYYAENRIALRSGYHCAQLVSRFLGIDGCLRASFYLYNSRADVERFLQVTKDAIDFFRRIGF
jgi:cysteine desulfurase/selenocysteine lyase